MEAIAFIVIVLIPRRVFIYPSGKYSLIVYPYIINCAHESGK